MASQRDRPVILIELMRFACALAVMACHYGVGFWRLPGEHPRQLLRGIAYASPYEASLQFGWLGVEMFFVISGLVIMRSAVGVSARSFAAHRALRLAPAAWVCATLTLLAVGAAGGFDASLWASWTRAVAFAPAGALVDGSYWTLGIEIAFYAAVALCLASGGGARRVEALVIALGLTSVAFWLWCAVAGAALFGSRVAQLLLFSHGCFFALGALIARCQTDRVTPLRAAAVAAMLAGGLIEVAAHAIESANDTGLPRAVGAALLLFAGGVALLAGAQRAQGVLARWVRPERARAFGMITYPLYLLHQDAGAALIAVLVRRGIAPGAALLATAAVVLVAAAVVARALEPALRRQLAHALSSRRGPWRGTPRTASLPTG